MDGPTSCHEGTEVELNEAGNTTDKKRRLIRKTEAIVFARVRPEVDWERSLLALDGHGTEFRQFF